MNFTGLFTPQLSYHLLDVWFSHAKFELCQFYVFSQLCNKFSQFSIFLFVKKLKEKEFVKNSENFPPKQFWDKLEMFKMKIRK